jgi:transcription antitermination factor NusG
MSLTNLDSGALDWFAIQVRSRWEQLTANTLSGKGYETLLPMQQSRSLGRGNERPAPLFPGYVFCRFDVLRRLPVLVTPGVIAVVSRGRVPVPIDRSEVTAIQTLVASGAHAQPWPYLKVGERVRIEDTPLRGLEGILIALKGSRRVVVSVTLLQRSVALEIDRAKVSAINQKCSAGIDSPYFASVADKMIA